MDGQVAKKKAAADGRVRKPSLVLSKTNLNEVKARKQSANLLQLAQLQRLHLQPPHPLLTIRQDQPSFGICFDIDGVLARGTVPLDAAVKAFDKLTDEHRRVHVPVVFITNSLKQNIDKANQISSWLGCPVSTDQIIQSPTPLKVFTKFHDKFSLIIGQGKLLEIAQKELGFHNVCLIEDVIKAYPLLDMVDHSNREKIAAEGYEATDFKRIELILLVGEPARWDSILQILIDLLRTNGKPDKRPPVEANATLCDTQLPVIACNADLLFMERACMPRFGHGAFLVCLEALFKKITGHDLQYTALIGKPSEITFRYAEHALTRESKKMGFSQPIKTMYLIGDSPDADIVGSNLYQRYIDRLKRRRLNAKAAWYTAVDGDDDQASENYDPELPESRNMPLTDQLLPQTVDVCEGILVDTGVYNPNGPAPDEEIKGYENVYHGHRDFQKNNELKKPVIICDDVFTAIDFILEKEEYSLDP